MENSLQVIDFRKLINYSDFKEIYKRIKNREGHLDSNCLFPGQTIRECLEEDELFIGELPNGFILIKDEVEYQRLFYFLNMEYGFPHLHLKKPLLVEEADNGGRRKLYLDNLSKELLGLGYQLVAKNLMVQIDLRSKKHRIFEELNETEERLHNEGIRYAFFIKEDIEKKGRILDLWKNNLKVTDVPHAHTLFDKKTDQKVLYVTNEEGFLCGVNWWMIRSSTCELRHTVTHSDFIRKGIGLFMVLKALEDAIEKECNLAISYIDVINDGSLRMYSKAGFEINRKTSLQFLLKPDKLINEYV